jgi:hypothetical protein
MARHPVVQREKGQGGTCTGRPGLLTTGPQWLPSCDMRPARAPQPTPQSRDEGTRACAQAQQKHLCMYSSGDRASMVRVGASRAMRTTGSVMS